jgi:predicted amidophosphoribosyltransferase
MAGAIVVREDATVGNLQPTWLVVVDDVVTTGATVKACLSALTVVESPGVRVCGAAAVAVVGDRPHRDGPAYDGGIP